MTKTLFQTQIENKLILNSVNPRFHHSHARSLLKQLEMKLYIVQKLYTPNNQCPLFSMIQVIIAFRTLSMFIFTMLTLEVKIRTACSLRRAVISLNYTMKVRRVRRLQIYRTRSLCYIDVSKI